MAWNQITIYTDRDNAESISDYLFELGALSVTLKEGGEEKIYEPLPGEIPLWSDTQVTGLFEQEISFEKLIPLLKQRFSNTLPPYETTVIEDQDWERVWLDDFKPMRFGRNLWIIPSTYGPVDVCAINIFLDPGLAFGTGTHATTAMCLKWLDSGQVNGASVIDFGCGSGILAIAAAKLGASYVDAVDIDPQALTATRANAKNNNVESCIKLYLPNQFFPDPVNILLANILAKPLIGFAKIFSDLVIPGGQVVLSGILEEQANEVISAYAPWFDIGIKDMQDGWVLIAGTKIMSTSAVLGR